MAIAVTDFLRDVRPVAAERGYEVRFETPPGEQAQVDFARFHVVFTDGPTTPRIVWLFSLVLGFSRLIWARFVVHQDLPTVLRCHASAFEALGGVPREVLHDRMKTAVIVEGEAGGIVYNRAIIDLARHYGFHPRACQPYRAMTKGKGGRPPFDPVSMFKALILQAQHNLSDARMEFMMRDRLSWMRFLGFDLGGPTP